MTNSEEIRGLVVGVAKLEERAEGFREEIINGNSERAKLTDSLNAIDKRLTVLEDRFAEVRRLVDEKDRRRWTIIVAVIGSVLTLIANIALLFARK